MPSRTAADFAQVLSSLRLDDTALRHPVGQTFLPGARARVSSLDSLPVLTAEGPDAPSAELRLGDLLGEGGRGEIRLARQLSLRRDVAVKRLKSNGPGSLELLREARVTGALEHPNVVPVYTLGRSDAGDVLLVMKRVSGRPWTELLAEAPALQSPVALERHLDVFRQVCHAVAFAHSRGVVHRDLKPDNVMVGEFGEVVVLDWGLAVSLGGDDERELPRAASVSGLAGTPAYMAPELVAGVGSALGPWTDVFLLGATLHHVLLGRPPYGPGTLEQVLEAAFTCAAPALSANVPPALAEVCRRAMALVPTERFSSVAALSMAVQDFLRHRQSAGLTQEALRRLETAAPDAELPTRLAQARFGFEQALSMWPQNDDARTGLLRCDVLEVELHLRRRDVAAAGAALGRLSAPSAELVERLTSLRAELDAARLETERLRRLEAEQDLELTARERNLFLVGTGVFWGIVPVLTGWAHQSGRLNVTAGLLLGAVGPWALGAAFALYLSRRVLFRNEASKRTGWAIVMGVAAAGLMRLVAYLDGGTGMTAMPYELGAYALITSMLGVLDRRFFFPAVIYAVGAVAAALHREQGFFIVGACNFLALGLMPLWWKQGQPPRERP